MTAFSEIGTRRSPVGAFFRPGQGKGYPPLNPRFMSEELSAMAAKIRRAYRKAGLEPSEKEAAAFLDKLLDLKVPILHRGSRRIAKVLSGEKPIESLLIEHGTAYVAPLSGKIVPAPGMAMGALVGTGSRTAGVSI